MLTKTGELQPTTFARSGKSKNVWIRPVSLLKSLLHIILCTQRVGTPWAQSHSTNTICPVQNKPFNKAHQLAPYATTPLINLGNLAYLQQDFEQTAYWWSLSLD